MSDGESDAWECGTASNLKVIGFNPSDVYLPPDRMIAGSPHKTES